MNNKIKSISHRSFGFRSAEYFIAAIYHCCARLPLPAEWLITLSGYEPINNSYYLADGREPRRTAQANDLYGLHR